MTVDSANVINAAFLLRPKTKDFEATYTLAAKFASTTLWTKFKIKVSNKQKNILEDFSEITAIDIWNLWKNKNNVKSASVWLRYFLFQIKTMIKIDSKYIRNDVSLIPVAFKYDDNVGHQINGIAQTLSYAGLQKKKLGVVVSKIATSGLGNC